MDDKVLVDGGKEVSVKHRECLYGKENGNLLET